MFDIGFYMKVYEFKQQVMNREINDIDLVWHTLESFRNPQPVVYNIETTNACNMRCEMCPRTTMMTRPIATLDMETFERVVDQIRPFSNSKWQEWQDFVEAHYGVGRSDMSENHFFLHVIPKVLVLHGYGDPLLDRQMPNRVSLLSQRGIPSYFSCNPANIDIDANTRMFENGLGYIKYSIESTDDVRHKEVRGQRSNFTNSYQKILQLLDMKDEQGYKTVIVVTMLNLNKPWQQEEFQKLRDAFSEKDVYVYLKSQDTQWYQGKKEKTPSIHWSEFCQFPWSSMTIKSNGEAAMCVEDFNNEIILGDAKKQSLCDIWNGEKYRQLRHNHLMLTRGIRCTERCDMSLVGSYLTSLA